jgi:hypothetical protein
MMCETKDLVDLIILLRPQESHESTTEQIERLKEERLDLSARIATLEEMVANRAV